jgi:hypothetical protein
VALEAGRAVSGQTNPVVISGREMMVLSGGGRRW